MNLMKRLLWINVCLLFVFSAFQVGHVVRAQGEPTAIVDAVFADLSQRLGRTVTRDNVDSWTWEQVNFPDSSLGCPQPGKAYSQVVTLGYKIVIFTAGIAYDYRVLNNGQGLFLCSPAESGQPPATPTSEPNPQPTVGPPPPPGGEGPVNFDFPLAYIGQDGNVSMVQTQSRSVNLTSDATGWADTIPTPPNLAHIYSGLVWSPHGNAFLYADILGSGTLYVVGSGNKPEARAHGILTVFGGAWSQDGSQVAYAVPTGQPAPGSDPTASIFQIQSIPVQGGGPQVAGSLAYGMGCGGGPPQLDEGLYMSEAGYQGNGQLFAWTAQGFVHSLNCTGLGIALTDTSGQVVWSKPDIARAAISPDRTRLVAIQMTAQGQTPPQPSGLVLIDVASGAVTPLNTASIPDQAAWSSDGETILYSSLAPAQTLASKDAASAVGQQLFFGNWPTTVKSYKVTVSKIAAVGGQAVQLFTKEGRGVGKISAVGENVAVSFISSIIPMVQQINAGASLEVATAVAPKVTVEVFPLNPGGAATAFAFLGGQPAQGPGQFSAVPAGLSNSNNPAANGSPGAPPALVVGGRAIVIVATDDSLNLRASPSRSAQVLRILKTGVTLAVLAGPVQADGYRWWQVRAEDDGKVGWVVDQAPDNKTGVWENTLAPQ